MKKLMLAVALALAPLGSAALAADKLDVVASFSILGDMVEQVGGDLISVETIVGPDADAHVYAPSAADAKAAAGADVIFVNGLGFETWSATLIETSGTKAPVVVATEGVEPLLVEGETDPHAWNSLKNGVIYVRNIAAGLAQADPANADAYAANAEAYIAEIMALDGRAQTAFAALPEDRRTVVTAHDAFGYLATSYGLEFLAPVGIDTEAEASARDVATLIDQIKAGGVAALFVENITSPALVEQIAAETGLKVGGQLYSDALSVKGGPATSYLKMFEHNTAALIAALSGEV